MQVCTVAILAVVRTEQRLSDSTVVRHSERDIVVDPDLAPFKYMGCRTSTDPSPLSSPFITFHQSSPHMRLLARRPHTSLRRISEPG